MAAILADENFPLPIVAFLRTFGHDVVTVRELNLDNRRTPGPVVFDKAQELNRAILTHNHRHFLHLHRERPDHAGIISCTLDPDRQAFAKRIDAAVGAQVTLRGQLLCVTRKG